MWQALVLSAGVLLADAEWPGWRGPTGDMHSPELNLAQEWPADGPPVVWSKPFGQGYSAFAGWQDRVYTQTQFRSGQFIVCLNAETGEELWSTRYDWHYDGGGLYPGPRSTPLVAKGRVYAISPEGVLYCLDARSGVMKWSLPFKAKFQGRGADFGYSCSPVISHGKLLLPVGGAGAAVIAIDPASGQILWHAGDGPASYCSIQSIELDGTPLAVALLENKLAIYRIADGAEVYQFELSQGYDEHSTAPLWREPYLFLAFPYKGGARSLHLKWNDEREGLVITTAWECRQMSNDIASCLLVDDALYGFDLREAQSRLTRPSRGEFRCIDWATGRVLWSSPTIGQANTIGANGMLLLLDDRGVLVLARPNRDHLEERSRVTMFPDEICWTAPTLHRGRVFLRTQTQAMCLDLRHDLGETPAALPSLASLPRQRKRWSVDPIQLIGAEREFPATPPEARELTMWTRYGLLAIAAAALWAQVADGLAWLAQRKAQPQLAGGFAPMVVYWGVIWSVALFGSLWANREDSIYVFLWPLGLWAALQGTMNTIAWAERQSDRRQSRWFSRTSGLGMIGVGMGYFWLCREMGLALEWTFITAWGPALPVAWLAAWLSQWQGLGRWLLRGASGAASYYAYMWVAAKVLRWRLGDLAPL